MTPFEVWQDPKTKVIFYFSHSDEKLTTGVMEIPAGAELPNTTVQKLSRTLCRSPENA
jgi:hypothetical protein